MVEISVVVILITYVIGLVTMIFAFLVLMRCSGRLRSAVLYLTFGILLIIAKKAFALTTINDEVVSIANLWFDFGIILLLFFSVYSMKKMISLINNRIKVNSNN